MNTYIALFRGINVGGNNILPMKELKRCTCFSWKPLQPALIWKS